MGRCLQIAGLLISEEISSLINDSMASKKENSITGQGSWHISVLNFVSQNPFSCRVHLDSDWLAHLAVLDPEDALSNITLNLIFAGAYHTHFKSLYGGQEWFKKISVTWNTEGCHRKLPKGRVEIEVILIWNPGVHTPTMCTPPSPESSWALSFSLGVPCLFHILPILLGIRLGQDPPLSGLKLIWNTEIYVYVGSTRSCFQFWPRWNHLRAVICHLGFYCCFLSRRLQLCQGTLK